MKAKGLPVNTPTIQHLNEIFQLPLDRYAAEYSTGMKRNWDLWHYCCKTMTYLFLTSRSMGGLEGMYPDEKTHPATESKRKDGDNFLTSHCLAKGNM